jgi:hypothetical protein
MPLRRPAARFRRVAATTARGCSLVTRGAGRRPATTIRRSTASAPRSHLDRPCACRRLDARRRRRRHRTALDIGLAALCAEAVGIMEGHRRRHHRRLPQDAPAVRPADRPLPGAAAPHGRHAAAPTSRRVDELPRRHALPQRMRASAPRTLSAAKVTIGQACRFIGQKAVQLHGGMGMTDELIVSHWFKRLTAIEMSVRRQRHASANLHRSIHLRNPPCHSAPRPSSAAKSTSPSSSRKSRSNRRAAAKS